ncbi:putative phosphoserine transaminase [Helianthus debilis subsp. tardiflorus]
MATSATTPNTLLLKNPTTRATVKPSPTHAFPTPRATAKPLSIKCQHSATTAAPVSPPTTSTDRLFNFAAGPATLPENVLLKAQSELYNWRGAGMSVMEMSHRGKEFLSIIQKAESDLRKLLDISDDYAVLFLQGGATTQFASIPLNICKPEDPVDYIVTGSWGDKAYKEATKYCKPKVIWTGKPEKYTGLPVFDELDQRAQKNVGPSGVTIVIIRKDLIGHAQESTPVMLDYKIHADNNSLYNTPPCYGIYMCGLVFEDLLAQGGLVEVEKKNVKKAQILYDAIEGSGGFYRSPVEKSVRSLMNVPFTLEKAELEGEFVKEAAKEGMVQLKGHRSVGGMRASIYNAMPLAGVEKLVAFMKEFQAKHG